MGRTSTPRVFRMGASTASVQAAAVHNDFEGWVEGSGSRSGGIVVKMKVYDFLPASIRLNVGSGAKYLHMTPYSRRRFRV